MAVTGGAAGDALSDGKLGFAGVAFNARVESSGGSDDVNHGVKGLGDGVLGSTGDLGASATVGEPLVLGIKKRLELRNRNVELDPAVSVRVSFYRFVITRKLTRWWAGKPRLFQQRPTRS